jgi:hypothetical protein
MAKAKASVPHDRSADIERTAKELELARIKYLKDKIGAKCPYLSPYLVEVLIRANATDMSSHEFRLLFTWATFANKDGTNAFPEHQTVANITGLSVSTLERATAELKALGWQSTERVMRRGKSIAFRTIKIPESTSLEPSPVTVLKSEKRRNYQKRKNTFKDFRTLTGEGRVPSPVRVEDISVTKEDNHEVGSTYVIGGGTAAEVRRNIDAVAQPKIAGYKKTRNGRNGATL